MCGYLLVPIWWDWSVLLFMFHALCKVSCGVTDVILRGNLAHFKKPDQLGDINDVTVRVVWGLRLPSPGRARIARRTARNCANIDISCVHVQNRIKILKFKLYIFILGSHLGQKWPSGLHALPHNAMQACMHYHPKNWSAEAALFSFLQGLEICDINHLAAESANDKKSKLLGVMLDHRGMCP